MKPLVAGLLSVLGLWGCAKETSRSPLKVLVAYGNEGRADAFEALLNRQGMEVGRLPWKALSADRARGYDVVLLDPQTGVLTKSGQSQPMPQAEMFSKPLDCPVLLVGEPGAYALTPLDLRYGAYG